MSTPRRQTLKESCQLCSFEKDNPEKTPQRLSSYREQQGENYKNLGVNLKLYFPNITNIFEHFRNNKL